MTNKAELRSSILPPMVAALFRCLHVHVLKYDSAQPATSAWPRSTYATELLPILEPYFPVKIINKKYNNTLAFTAYKGMNTAIHRDVKYFSSLVEK
jgi:hypothetical protein